MQMSEKRHLFERKQLSNDNKNTKFAGYSNSVNPEIDCWEISFRHKQQNTGIQKKNHCCPVKF